MYVHAIYEMEELIYFFLSFGTIQTTLSNLVISGNKAKMACHVLTAFYSLQMQNPW